MTSLTAKPTIIFVPGAWHGPEGFKATADLLQSAGYQTVAIATPSVGASPALDSFDPDVAVVRKAAVDALNQDADVVMVFHSYGGMIGCEALRGLSKRARNAEGKANGIVRLVHMTSFVPVEGTNLIDMLGGELPPWIKQEEGAGLIAETPEAIFYNDLDNATARYWSERLKPHSGKTFESRTSYAAWRDIPNTYIFCEKDAAIPVAGQEAMVEKARESGAEFETERLDASHSPFLSMPSETAACIRRAAGETVVGMRVVDALNQVTSTLSG